MSCDRETLTWSTTFKLDENRLRLNQHAKDHLVQKLLPKHTNTDQIDRSTLATKLVGNNRSSD